MVCPSLVCGGGGGRWSREQWSRNCPSPVVLRIGGLCSLLFFLQFSRVPQNFYGSLNYARALLIGDINRFVKSDGLVIALVSQDQLIELKLTNYPTSPAQPYEYTQLIEFPNFLSSIIPGSRAQTLSWWSTSSGWSRCFLWWCAYHDTD